MSMLATHFSVSIALTKSEARRTLLDALRVWMAGDRNIWLISSRLSAYTPGMLGEQGFTVWELQPLNHAQRSALAHRLSPLLQHYAPTETFAEQYVDDFVRSLERHPRAAAWSEIPLLFTLATLVSASQGMLPESRTQLYRQT